VVVERKKGGRHGERREKNDRFRHSWMLSHILKIIWSGQDRGVIRLSQKTNGYGDLSVRHRIFKGNRFGVGRGTEKKGGCCWKANRRGQNEVQLGKKLEVGCGGKEPNKNLPIRVKKGCLRGGKRVIAARNPLRTNRKADRSHFSRPGKGCFLGLKNGKT